MKMAAQIILETNGINPKAVVAYGIAHGWVHPPPLVQSHALPARTVLRNRMSFESDEDYAEYRRGMLKLRRQLRQMGCEVEGK